MYKKITGDKLSKEEAQSYATESKMNFANLMHHLRSKKEEHY